MGRIKTTLIKRTARKLLTKYPEKFSVKFEENKPGIKDILPTANKKLRNNIAGYIARLAKHAQKNKI